MKPSSSNTAAARAAAQIAAGRAHVAERRFDAARAAYEAVLAMPDGPAALKVQAGMAIGNSWRQEGWRHDREAMWAEARTALARVLDIPGVTLAQQVEALRGVAWNVGVFASDQGYAAAVAELNRIMKRPALPPAARACVLIALGKCHLQQNRIADARAALTDAMAQDGIADADRAEAQLRLGLCAYHEHDDARTAADLRPVLTLSGASPAQVHEATLRLRLRNLLPGGEPCLTVLFIGCSHTDNSDVPAIVEALAASAPAGRPRIVAGRATRGGHTLKKLWELGPDKDQYGQTPRAAIAADPWDVVVFQDISVGSHDDLVRYAAEFAALIRSRNAVPVLYETFVPFAQPYPGRLEAWHREHLALSRDLDMALAPGGDSWIRYLGPKPDEARRLALYHADRSHAGDRGAYLLACCLYAAITGDRPVGLTPRVPHLAGGGLAPDEAAAMQAAAWAAYRESNPDPAPAP